MINLLKYKIAVPLINYYRNNKLLYQRKIAVNHIEHNFEVFKSNINEADIYKNLEKTVLRFVSNSKVSENEYLYSKSSKHPTLYASMYACLIYKMFGKIDDLNSDSVLSWKSFFDSYQSPKDGLFYDNLTNNKLFFQGDWWGVRHLAVHTLNAYNALGLKPKYELNYIKNFYKEDKISSILKFDNIMNNDSDNLIINIASLLQFQRDLFHDSAASSAIDFLKNELIAKYNNDLGGWGKLDLKDPSQLSRYVQYIYHILTVFTYDKECPLNHNLVAKNVLKTQNKYGGYGIYSNSSACEDIDSIFILMKCYPFVEKKLKEKINLSFKNALYWILFNQSKDGGFQFRLGEDFIYGSNFTKNKSFEGSMFPTWFRCLSLSYILNHLKIKNKFVSNNSPSFHN